MSTAYSRVRTAPDPAASGTELTVMEDDGHKFPTVPFPALLWPVNANPSTTNSERVTVTAVEGDVLTVVRADSPIELDGNMMIAATGSPTRYEFGDNVTLSHDFFSHDGPYALVLRTPTGDVAEYGSATGVVDDGDGYVYFNFEATRAGHWSARFESATQLGPDDPFFVAPSATLR